MRRSRQRLLLVAAYSLVACGAVGAQTRPSASQAAELLRSRPDLVQQLRQRIGGAGLTPEQVRARLRAEGYPENLLDAYLPGASSGAVGAAVPDADVFSAVRALGIADSADVSGLDADALGCNLPPESLTADTLVQADEARRERYLREERCRSLRVIDSLEQSARPSGRNARLAALYPDSGFAIFGLDLFGRRTTQFDPNVAGPVDANYRLGPGDRLVLILTGDVEAAYTLDVTREGFVVIPQVGQVYVANTTLAQLEDQLYSRLGRVYSGVRRGGGTTRFSVTPARLRSNQVYVLGDVERPGSYRVSAAGTSLSALYAAGGPTERGSLRQIEVRRGGRVVSTFDLYDYLVRGDASRDVRLETGDIVFVPVHGPQARIVGEVTRPATYETRRGETLADLLRFAGGFLPTASRTRVQIERVLPPEERAAPGRERTVLDIGTDARASGALPAIPVEAGDVLRVYPIAERVRNRVSVTGNVWAPGTQGYRAGMRLSDALRGAGGLQPDTYLGQVLVTRLRPDSSRVQLRATLRDTTGIVVDDIALQEDDEIRVFSTTEFRPTRYVSITGAVRRSGQYAYRDGMTMRDLVLLAGGLRESALLEVAEIARLPEDRRNGVTARTVRVPLDSSYLFERAPDGRYVGPPGLPAPAGNAPEVALRAYDNVLVLRQPEWELQRMVYVGGEVRFPGRYALVSKGERLVDLIRRAGGLTGEAHADGVVFVRRSDGNGALVDAMGALARDTAVGALGGLQSGRVGIDLPRALQDVGHQDNLLLQDGDSIFVPQYNPVVTVVGAVNRPVAVSYVPGADIDFYVRAAGGPRRNADTRRAFVTQPNGKVESVSRRRFFPDGEPRPRAGGVVAVPARDPADRRDLSAVVSTTLQVLSGVATLIFAVVAIRNSNN